MQGRYWCGRDSQGLSLFWSVSRTSKTRGGTSSGSWQKRVCFPPVGLSPFILGNLFFVVPLQSSPDVRSCRQSTAPGEDVVAVKSLSETRLSAGSSLEHQQISFIIIVRVHQPHLPSFICRRALYSPSTLTLTHNLPQLIGRVLTFCI